jgi:hypothetical protein
MSQPFLGYCAPRFFIDGIASRQRVNPVSKQMEEKPKPWWRGFSLRYLLFETALVAAACGLFVMKRPAQNLYVSPLLGFGIMLAVVGAAIGGLIRRPGTGAFVGAGIAIYILVHEAVN